MDSQKWEAGIRYRVDQSSHHIAFLWAQYVIISPKGYYVHRGIFTTHLTELVGLESSTGDDIPGLYFDLRITDICTWLCAKKQSLPTFNGQGIDLTTGKDFTTSLLDSVRVSMSYFYKIGDPGLR